MIFVISIYCWLFISVQEVSLAPVVSCEFFQMPEHIYKQAEPVFFGARVTIVVTSVWHFFSMAPGTLKISWTISLSNFVGPTNTYKKTPSKNHGSLEQVGTFGRCDTLTRYLSGDLFELSIGNHGHGLTSTNDHFFQPAANTPFSQATVPPPDNHPNYSQLSIAPQPCTMPNPLSPLPWHFNVQGFGFDDLT